MDNTTTISSISIEEEASHVLLSLFREGGIDFLTHEQFTDTHGDENSSASNGSNIYANLLMLNTNNGNSLNDYSNENNEESVNNYGERDENNHYGWSNEYDRNHTTLYSDTYYSDHASIDHPFADVMQRGGIVTSNQITNDTFSMIPAWTLPSSIPSAHTILLPNNYTLSQRLSLLYRYYTKREKRKIQQQKFDTDGASKQSIARYDCRKSLADSRIRINGRFVKAEVADNIAKSLLVKEKGILSSTISSTGNLHGFSPSTSVSPVLKGDKIASSLLLHKNTIPGLYIPQKMIHISKSTILTNDSGIVPFGSSVVVSSNVSTPLSLSTTSSSTLSSSSSYHSQHPKRKRIESIETLSDAPNNISSNQSMVGIDEEDDKDYGYESNVSVNPVTMLETFSLNKKTKTTTTLTNIRKGSRSRLLSIDSTSSVDAEIKPDNYRKPKLSKLNVAASSIT